MSQLRTTWICIATEGETVDGREILRDEIIDMADTYDPDLYTAMIWGRHNKPGENRGLPLGEVIELSIGADKSDVLHLYAIFRPFARLIELNSHNAGVFTSVEMTPDFRGSGKTYLTGLAVTDTPASVGTTRLHFSRNDKGNRNMKTKAKKSTWRQMFGIEEPEVTPVQNGSDDEKLQALAEELNAALSRIAELEAELAQTVQDVEVVKEVVDTEDFARLRDSLPELTKSFSKVATQVPGKTPGTKRKEFNHL